MSEMIQADYKLFIHRRGTCLLDPVKTDLLFAIQKAGSLRAAANSLKISYQHAWTMIDAINQASFEPVVAKQRGGTGGGGAMLTAYGERLLKDYQAIDLEVHKFFLKLNLELNL